MLPFFGIQIILKFVKNRSQKQTAEFFLLIIRIYHSKQNYLTAYSFIFLFFQKLLPYGKMVIYLHSEQIGLIIILMNSKIFGILVAIVLACNCANWAVLIAGSNTWFNYRHQADVFHAYQMLLKKGFDAEKIIVFAYDDIANNTRNPFLGKVFNKPSYKQKGTDVYSGVKIDYKGADVTPQLFLSVLEGNKAAVQGKGTGKVLQSTPQDNVIMFFSDHGAPNLIAFPSKYLYADQLLATFNKMNGKFAKFVFYLETCQSGSMFVNLPKNTKIYAVSAANPTQSSWGTYCSPDDVIEGKHIGTCLGDLFSVNFIEDCENTETDSQSLQEQFEKIRVQTTLSHVMQWGDLSYVNDKVGSFIGKFNRLASYINLRRPLPSYKSPKSSVNFDSRLMKIKILTETHKRERTAQSEREMKEQMQDMQRLDDIFYDLIQKFKLTGKYSARHMNYDCMRAVMDNHTNKCGRLSDYGLTFAKYYAQACETIPAETIMQNIHC